MDVAGVLAILVFALVCGLSIQRPQDIAEENTTQLNDSTTVEAKTCETARRIPGSCVLRQYCDFGTPAIDRTLFAPRGYIRPCNDDQVCCPFEAQSRQPEASGVTPSPLDDDLDFAEGE